jgi:VPS62-like protein
MTKKKENRILLIRASRKTGKEAKGEPTLLVSNTSNYGWIYDDRGSGSDMDGSFYRPYPTDASFCILGDYAQGNYNSPIGTSVIVKAINDDPKSPLLKAPNDYSQIWNDQGSGGDYDGSIWYPKAPDGYLAIGFVASSGYDKPSIPSYMCVRRDLVVDAQPGSLIWNDQGSGADEDVAVYQIVGASGLFVAQGNYDPYKGPCYKLKL